ncbi:hypothetical protein KI427_26585 (plasmid) [Rhodococcus ruber]|uniref:AMP-binding enzyme n=1 Tax=Rhodococcus TaxID=1827 RepID=UPI001471A70A|nr:hypothetical protein KXC42_24910 [Rhodococcus sp. LW-XY12]UQB75796.1 hypothetical protein KI427_26585 [Rhodococcus ruber]
MIDACVVGRKDERWGESVHAVVVGSDPVDVEVLEVALRERLAGYKVPRSWEVRDAVPRSEAGKLLRRVVRAEVNGDR